MATTTNFGWETPDDTDLVKDGAAAIRTLGGAIDTSLVDLKGGTTSQVLSKASNTDMDFTWATVSAVPTNASATVATAQSTTSASYTDLTTSGPSVTLTTGTKALVIVSSWIDGTASVDFAISGATTRSASDTTRILSNNVAPFRMSSAQIVTVTAGSNTFTMKYKDNSGGTSTFQNRQISVIDMGS